MSTAYRDVTDAQQNAAYRRLHHIITAADGEPPPLSDCGPYTDALEAWEEIVRDEEPTDPSALLIDFPHLLEVWSTSENGVHKKDEAGDGDSLVYWYEGKRGLKIRQTGLLRWLEAQGITKAYLGNASESVYLRIEGQIVGRVSRERIRDVVLTHARSLPSNVLPDGYDAGDLEEKLVKGANVYFSDRLFRSMPASDLPFHRDGPDTAHLFYRNGIVRVQPEKSFEWIGYEDLDTVVWRDQVIPFDLKPQFGALQEQMMQSDWGRFLYNVAGADVNRHRALLTSIGYLLHAYKDPTRTRAVTLMDQAISDMPQGGSGKSLIGKGLAQMTGDPEGPGVVEIEGKKIAWDSPFLWQRVRHSTQVIHFDDAGPRFPFERIFSEITSGLEQERKGRDPMYIPFAHSPKFLITTNYVVPGTGGSFRRRMHEVELSSHYHEGHTPEDDFGRRFFSPAWTEDDWMGFHHTMICALALYMHHGLLSHDPVAREFRRLRQETCPAFADWITGVIEEGKSYERGTLLRGFREEHEEHEEIAASVFGHWLEVYAAIYGFEIKASRPRKPSGKRVRVRKFVQR